MSVLKCYFNIFYLIIFPIKQGDVKPVFLERGNAYSKAIPVLYRKSAPNFIPLPRGTSILFRVVFLMSQSDKHSAQHSEHISLNECDKKFQTVHEDHQQEGNK